MNFQNGNDTDGEENIDYGKLNASMNRKQKQAGGWQAMGLDQPIYKAILRLGYKQPTQIQRKAIPLILNGRDVVGMSRTGSGKTAAFVVPMLQRLKKREPCGFRALLLSPTRELALQTFKVVKDLGRFTGLRSACLVGGDDMDQQFSVLHENPDIVIATPGRFLHIVIEMSLKLSSVQYLVFDEADRLFEMGFSEQIQDILKRVPDGRQTLLFSATLPKMLVEFAKAGLSDPHLVRLDLDAKISDKLAINFVSCRPNDKLPALLFLCRWAVRTQQQAIIFCATMKHVEYLASVCREAGLENTFLYSQLDSTARKINISRFRNRECMLLIVTDVAARGVDIPLLDIAINYQFPPTAKLFVHRVGRVARAGRAGTCFSLVSMDELPYVVDVFLFLNRPVKFVDETNASEDDVCIGRFPESLAHTELEFLRSITEISTDIKDLLQRSENAMRKYERTRAQPSKESIRRVKNELRLITPAIHPFFQSFLDAPNDKQKAVLDGIGQWRPNATIFEINTSSKQAAAAIMKQKRKMDQQFIEKKKLKAQKEGTEKDEENESQISDAALMADESDVIQVFDQIVKATSFHPTKPLALNGKAKRRAKRGTESNASSQTAQSRYVSAAERRAQEKLNHFVSYAPSDANREAALAVNANSDAANFDREARQITVDINADDDAGMYRNQKQKVWDRKRKKFVSGEDPKKKKIRTEDGTWVPASYKSGRYENWQKDQRANFHRDDDDDNEKDGNGTVGRSGRFRGKARRFGGDAAGGGKGKGAQVRSELRNADQIMKERRRKTRIHEYQTHRRNENTKKREAMAGRDARAGGAKPKRNRGVGAANKRGKFGGRSSGAASGGGKRASGPKRSR